MLLMLLNLKEQLVKFTCNTIYMGKILPETTNIQQSRLFGANQQIESVFLRRHFFIIFVSFVYLVYSFDIFHFYISSFSLLYLGQIFEKVLYGWANSEAYLEPNDDGGFHENYNGFYFRRKVPSRCDHVYTKRTFLFKRILKFSCSFNPFQSCV